MLTLSRRRRWAVVRLQRCSRTENGARAEGEKERNEKNNEEGGERRRRIWRKSWRWGSQGLGRVLRWGLWRQRNGFLGFEGVMLNYVLEKQSPISLLKIVNIRSNFSPWLVFIFIYFYLFYFLMLYSKAFYTKWSQSISKCLFINNNNNITKCLFEFQPSLNNL